MFHEWSGVLYIWWEFVVGRLGLEPAKMISVGSVVKFTVVVNCTTHDIWIGCGLLKMMRQVYTDRSWPSRNAFAALLWKELQSLAPHQKETEFMREVVGAVANLRCNNRAYYVFYRNIECGWPSKPIPKRMWISRWSSTLCAVLTGISTQYALILTVV